MADKIMIIRHGEKPGDQPPPFGIDTDGNQHGHELSVRGWQRAGGLALLFGHAEIAATRTGLAVPTTICATNPDQTNPSKRPQHTVTPLADALGLQLNLNFAVRQEVALADFAVKATGSVLICWHHEAIPAIAARLLRANIPKEAGKWPGDDCFDRIWLFDRIGAGWRFSQTSQLIFAGDVELGA